jgi:squalene synthase HpnC
MNSAPVLTPFDDSLREAPPLYHTPAARPTQAEASAWCKRLATTHYENFHVATGLLPARLRPHFYALYAFCRMSDDLGDEVATPAIATHLLGAWREMLHRSFAEPGSARHPVLVALEPTVRRCELPLEPFDDLITAFEEDQVITHHPTLASLKRYSRCSANPVGRLVLMVSGYNSPELFAHSDDICTGLQLANFYQDVIEDAARGRRYLPADAMERFGVTDDQIHERRTDENFRSMMRFLVDDARTRLRRGARIVALVDRDLASTLSLFVAGGLAICDAIEAQGYDTLSARPVVSKGAKLRLLLQAFAGKLTAWLPGHRKAIA